MSNGYTSSGTKSFNELLREKESFRDVVPGQDPGKLDNNYQDKHTENVPDGGDKAGLPPAKVKSRTPATDLLNAPDPDQRAGQVIDRMEQIINGTIKPTDYGLPGNPNAERRLMRLEKLGDTRETATIAVMSDGKILMGKRRDTGLWTFPGGGLKAGEDPSAGAARELYEEAGLRGCKLKHLTTKDVAGRTGRHVRVHCYKADLSSAKFAHGLNDPDNEVEKWEWVDCSKGLPEEVKMALHTPKNLLLQSLGLMEGDNVEVPPALTDPGLV